MNKIKRFYVESSNIEAIGFDYEEAGITSPAWATMRVWFKYGSVYDYDKVPMHVFEALKKAAMTGESVGSHFKENIKGKYQFKKV